ncbi:CocE/NonD family hydrolase [Silvibacterium dinghuense]|uniref:CocE/NonD family hydrolase n=2 Tax=Silvibacterium dinghuense TaxID=1560006 RepID=A0A4Q1SL12_9BACT|nr:CocE/NonD family hydrolase [Silvibacterium dinghuense]
MVLTPAGGNDFTTEGSKLRYEFTSADGGKATALHWTRSVRGVPTPTEAARVSDTPEHNHFRPYSRQEVMIPMRDGIKLHAIILRPTDTHEPLPFMMQRTPYGVDGYVPDRINAQFTELAQSGYIFVMEDIRGRYESQGQFVMMRPIAAHHDPHSSDTKNTDESTDTYDTVAWLIKNVPENNGRVGVAGVSYPGFLAAEAGIDPHPAVKAISPQAPMTDVWVGDDFFHNGAFRQTYGYDYVLGMESSKEATFQPLKEDAYDFFLKAGSFAAAGKSNVDDLPTGKAFLAHPGYDDFWQSRAVQPHLDRVTVPTLEVGGWWDQEDMWGPQAEYAALKPHDAQHEVYIALGPWNHGQWTLTTRHLGAVDFGSATGDWFRQHIEAPFFAHYLKDQPGFDAESAISFQTGSNTWKQYPVWPPKQGIVERNLYLGTDHALSFDRPAAAEAFTAYTSDPASPVNYRKRPIEATYSPTGSHWYYWLVENQKPYETRSDVATWKTPVLDHDVTITGDVLADILASTSGTDSDWVVKLIDENPDDASLGNMAGYQLMVVDEIFRGRYRESYEHPQAIPAGKPEEYKFSLHGADHVFKQGHRIVVQVQSSWFPLYDRNPQTFVPNIMKAKPSDYKAAEQHIYASSHIVLPVAE